NTSLLSNIIDEIKRICHAARYNKSICNIFIELVICSAEPIVRLLQYKKDDVSFELENLKLDDLTILEQFKIALVNIKELSKLKDMNPRFSITDINEYESLKDNKIDN
ncbi:9254_t:CDS:2, partial [Dentiscutata erythropus]